MDANITNKEKYNKIRTNGNDDELRKFEAVLEFNNKRDRAKYMRYGRIILLLLLSGISLEEIGISLSLVLLVIFILSLDYAYYNLVKKDIFNNYDSKYSNVDTDKIRDGFDYELEYPLH